MKTVCEIDGMTFSAAGSHDVVDSYGVVTAGSLNISQHKNFDPNWMGCLQWWLSKLYIKVSVIKKNVMDLRGCALLNSSVIEIDLCQPHNKSLLLITPMESPKARLIMYLY